MEEQIRRRFDAEFNYQELQRSRRRTWMMIALNVVLVVVILLLMSGLQASEYISDDPADQGCYVEMCSARAAFEERVIEAIEVERDAPPIIIEVERAYARDRSQLYSEPPKRVTGCENFVPFTTACGGP